MNRSDKVAILGGGLTAVYSFYGAIEAGYKPYDIDIMVMSKNPRLGSIFMYTSPIPWIKIKVHNILWGTCDGYAYKQWKDSSHKTSAHTRFQSGETDLVIEELYDPEGLYQTLWNRIPVIKNIGFLTGDHLLKIKHDYKAVICTFPDESTKMEYLNYIVRIPISFRKETFFSTLYSVIYNGLPEVPWIRRTTMPGRIYTEYPSDFSDDIIRRFEEPRESDQSVEIARIPDLKPNTPPLTLSQRIQENMLTVGRQAIFDRKYLSHYAQIDVRNFLEGL